jgi:hypothetical protein
LADELEPIKIIDRIDEINSIEINGAACFFPGLVW